MNRAWNKYFSLPLLFVCLLLTGPALADDSPVYRPQVLERLAHNPAHFTQGLFISDGFLYESTGHYGRSLLARKDLLSGRSLAEVPLAARYFGEGSCRVGDIIYVLTWKENTCLLFDAHSLEQIGSFSYAGEGWGLTWNGLHLIRSDGSNLLHFHDLDGSLAGSLEIWAQDRPVYRLNELEWLPDEELVLANIWQTTRVAAIDPLSGQVVYWLELEDLVPESRGIDVANGLALAEDGRSLWLTGKFWPIIYQVEWPVHKN